MDKKIKTIVVLMLTLAGLCVGFACIALWFSGDTPDDTTQQQTGSTTIFTLDPTTLQSLAYTFDKEGDGVAELWSYTCDENGAWHWVDDESVSLSSSAFSTLTETITTIAASRTLTHVTAEEFETYGLKNPAKAIRVKDALYGEQAVYFGAFNAYNQTYYVSLGDNTSTVYMVSADIYSMFEYAVESLVSFNDLPGELKEPQIVSLTYQKGETSLTITPRQLYETVTGEAGTGEEETTTTITAGFAWDVVTQSGETYTLDKSLAQTLVSHVTQMNYLGCLAATTATDKTYGFDQETATMTLVYLDNAGEQHTFTLTLGGKTDYGYYYARPQGTNYVMLLGGISFAQVFEGWEAP